VIDVLIHLERNWRAGFANPDQLDIGIAVAGVLDKFAHAEPLQTQETGKLYYLSNKNDKVFLRILELLFFGCNDAPAKSQQRGHCFSGERAGGG
jgi:hypothetical protein